MPDPDSIEKVIQRLREMKPEQNGKYLHWDELRRRTPPHGLTAAEWWCGVFLNRQPLQKTLPLTNVNGKPFSFAMTEGMQSLAHQIDRDATGSIRAPEAITNKATQQRYLVRSLIEEALTSSQLEGAVATAKEAKQIIRAGRSPKNTSERMVLNNYHAMEFIRERRDEPLTPEFVSELHTVITTDTLDDPKDAGRIRTNADDVKVVDHGDGTVLHTPPDASKLNARILAMCKFANGGGDGFIHPVVRAVLLHFWIGHDHPFCDGNGRTARALFYWSMLSQGYWLTEYVSISRILRQAASKYVRSYLYSETWPYDATHFVLYQLEAIQRSIEDLHQYLESKVQEIHEVESLLHDNRDLNHRQLALLSEALRNPGTVFTMASHKQSHRVSHETARQDLYKLRDVGLLEEHKRGRTLEFTPVANINRVLATVHKKG
jgi:Fic family protein